MSAFTDAMRTDAEIHAEYMRFGANQYKATELVANYRLMRQLADDAESAMIVRYRVRREILGLVRGEWL